jgi:hypothetical protein
MTEDTTIDVPVADQEISSDSLDSMLGDILNNSPIMEAVERPPEAIEEETDDEAPDLEGADEDAELEEDGDDENEAPTSETEDDEGEESTQEAATEALDEEGIDWDFEVPVKIDGTESNVTMEELRKGYSTQQHLTRQGQELGEQRKAFETEKAATLAEMADMSAMYAEGLMKEENSLAVEYSEIKADIEKLREDGDKYAISERKDDLDQAQEKYWEARKSREASQEGIKGEQNKVLQAEWDARVNNFNDTIQTLIPDYSETMAEEIRQFALAAGVADNIVNSVTDPVLVKFVNDFRLQSTGLSKGKEKRKAAPTRKATPTKKSTPAKQKAAKATAALANKINSGDMSEDDQMDYLRSRASQHFK